MKLEDCSYQNNLKPFNSDDHDVSSYMKILGGSISFEAAVFGIFCFFRFDRKEW